MYIGDPHRNKPFVKHLTSYYPFNSDYNDKILPYVHLSISGGISIAPAVIGNGAHCPAGTSASLRDATSSPTRFKHSFSDGVNDVPYSISMHVKIISSGATQGGTILGKNVDNSSAAGTNSEYRINVTTDLSQIQFTKFSEGANTNWVRYTITAPPTNVWFYLVVTDDAAGNVNIYINGVSQFKITTTGGTGFVKYSQTLSSFFGSFNAMGVGSVARFLEGGIDDLGIFKGYILAQEDIDWIWNGGNPRRLKNVS